MTDARIAQLRTDYAGTPLLEADVGADPSAFVRGWLEDAVRAELKDPNAMTLATVDAAGDPDARIVLLKGIEGHRYQFFTNYESAKGAQIAHHPRGTLVLYWPELERQVRIRGRIEKVETEVSKAYFQSRPRPSQVGAWASAQSSTIESRAALEARFAETEARFEGQDPLPLPEFWGGYAVVADEIELWQGRRSRLHDRLVARCADGAWSWSRRAP